MRAVGRIFATIIGYSAAVIAAALFLLAAKVGLEPDDPAFAGWFWTQFALYGGFAAALIGAATFVPAAVVILVTEIFAIRSLVVHGLIGGAFGLAAALGVGGMDGLPRPGDMAISPNATLLLAAGFVAGLVYWAIAGRMAGVTPPVSTDPAGDRPR